ncbi:mir domain protein [Lasius niger]|uniref:Mir domain protein n=1 Tax=Lasius niger TaxID=67767 RepID=A0A0J7L143_LASNI|nr:mir domain protein [Lasius niger]
MVSALHNAPDLPADGRVAKRHDDQRQYEDHDQHVDLVKSPQQSGFGITNAPIGNQSDSDLFVRLKHREKIQNVE